MTDRIEQLLTTPICNAEIGCNCSYVTHPNAAKFFDLAFTTKFKNKTKKSGSVGTLKRNLLFLFRTPHSRNRYRQLKK